MDFAFNKYTQKNTKIKGNAIPELKVDHSLSFVLVQFYDVEEEKPLLLRGRIILSPNQS